MLRSILLSDFLFLHNQGEYKLPSRPSTRGHLSDSTRRTLNEVIAKDIKERERSREDRFDDILVNKLITICLAGTDDVEEAKCVVRRFLTLTHGMHIDKIDTLFASLNLSASKVMEMSA